MALDLLTILTDAGVQRLRDSPTEMWGACPKHKERTGKEDRRPSWSVSKTNFMHNCFSCHYSGTLTGLLVDLTGVAPPDLENTLKSQGFLRKMGEVRAQPDTVVEPVLPYLTDWALTNVLVDVPQGLLNLRRLIRGAIDHYQVRWNRESRVWVMPLREPETGDLLGAQLRKVGSVLTQPAGLPKSTTLFGYREMLTHDTCVLVESPLDAVRLFGLGIPAIAALGSQVSAQQATLMARAYAAVYVALDNDKAGQDGAERCTDLLRKRGCAVIPWRYEGLLTEDGEPAKDPGDVASDDALMESWDRTRRCGL